MENLVIETSSTERSQLPVNERIEKTVLKLDKFYAVCGHLPEAPGALALMAEVLTAAASDQEIDAALTRCARECRYPIRLPDILQRIPGQELSEPEAEARKAWDVLLDFVDKWVQSDVHGSYSISRGVRSKEPPQLSQRILGTVRRTGGWSVYKVMTSQDFPFVQKRFLEEYLAWNAVETIPLTQLLFEVARRELPSKSPEAKGLEAPDIQTPPKVPFLSQAPPAGPCSSSQDAVAQSHGKVKLPRHSPLRDGPAREARLKELRAQVARAQEIARSAEKQSDESKIHVGTEQ